MSLKKIICGLLAICVCGVSAWLIGASFREEEGEHGYSCSYELKIAEDRCKASDATCTQPATYYYSCTCGNVSPDKTFEAGNPAGHIWKEGKCMICEQAQN